ncbi:MAG: hypothetical protein HZC41_19900 [Chloroflexi bacterium]|nr:hypothetical protein [Chloroflexota bacterium]
MTIPVKMTLADMVLSLRQRLLDAREQDDRASLGVLQTTFGALIEASYGTQERTLIEILIALEDAARDAAMGVGWKSDIPSVEGIQQAFEIAANN